MDSLINAAARALGAGDPIGALKQVALRDDPAALALRGIAMAQLGELVRARDLLRQAARGFGVRDERARARCRVAEAEVSLALRDLGDSDRGLAAAVATLEAHADHANAFQARLILIRRLVLLGQLEEAASALACLPIHRLPPALEAVAALASAELALRSLRIGPARTALARSQAAAVRSGVPALCAEVAQSRAVLDRTAARRLGPDGEEALSLDGVARLLSSEALVVDACRRGMQRGPVWRSLARRPVLFALVRALAEAWPGAAARPALIAAAFRCHRPDASHRARLRVELGRLRVLAGDLVRLEAVRGGFALKPRDAHAVAVLAPPVEGDSGALMALLSDGAAWSTSALALALGTSQRTVQRALAVLEAAGEVRPIGHARALRWVAPPLTGFTTVLLLPATLPRE